MAVKTSTPWWVSALLALGLLFLFAGERVLAHMDTVSSVLTWLGLLLVAGSTGVRAWAFAREQGKRKSVERLLLICHGGVILALVIYFLFGTAGGQELVGIEEGPKASTMATVAWLLVMGISLIPLLMVELSLGVTGRDWFSKPGGELADEAAVEHFRVREMATNGLTIALAAAFLMVTCNVAKQRDVREDVSYFKTSRPGSATINMTASLSQPLKVLLFFPPVNETADEVEAYFRALGEETGGKVTIERHDRIASPGLAQDYKVQADGTVVLVREETPDEKAKRQKAEKEALRKENATPPVPAHEKLTVPVEFVKARRQKLREFDAEVQKSLMKVIRAKRVAYLSTGHGELNDPKSANLRTLVDTKASASAFRQILTILNYDVKEWDGFGKPVPDDATLLVVLGPRQALLDEDLRAIADYLDRGGALFLALDPKSDAQLGVLEGRLGVKFDKTPLTDDKAFFPVRRNPSDHRFAITNQFSSHASLTTLNRAGERTGIPLLEAGNLVDADFMVEEGRNAPKRTYVIRSMTSSFLDKPSEGAPQGNFSYDRGSEARKRYNVAAAVEGGSAKGPKEEDKKKPAKGPEKMRALVFADVDIFEDRALASFGPLQFVVRDAALWLGGEEELAGETVDEKDTVIEHTKSEDVVWFYLSLVGAPVVILGVGLGGVMWRRRRAQRRRS